MSARYRWLGDLKQPQSAITNRKSQLRPFVNFRSKRWVSLRLKKKTDRQIIAIVVVLADPFMDLGAIESGPSFGTRAREIRNKGRTVGQTF
jgi:hypothetical protein